MTVPAVRTSSGASEQPPQRVSSAADSSRDDGARRETPLPWAKLSVLICVRLSEPINATLIQPFVYQMVADLKVAKDPRDIAFYAAMLFSSFSVCQTLTVMHWGRLSDRIGRRPVLLVGLTGYLVSFLLFGVSRSFAWALAARCLNGLLAGNVAVIKSAFAEISDDTNRARILALVPLIWNVGSAAGAALGGLAADPVHQYPRWFGRSELFRTFPYLLPCLIGCSVTACGLAMAVFMLEETLVRKPAPRTIRSRAASQDMPATEASQLLVTEAPRQRTTRELLTPTVLRVMATNVVIYLALAMSNQAYPIFAATDIAHGGLGLSPRNIGYSLAISAAAVIYLQLHLYPRLERKHGSLRCYQIGMQLLVPCFIVLPFLSLVAAGADKSLGSLWPLVVDAGPWSAAGARYYSMWALLIAIMLIRSAGVVFVNTSINLMAVNLAPTKADLGSMNGIQQLASSTTRFIGPVISGIAWSWSIKHGLPYPFNAHLVWVLCAALTAISLKMSVDLPQSVNVFQASRVTDRSDTEEA
ncbi:hypothetical protein H4R19_000608 [Coemansia spiralis]|nr:hypothetical protein H4R19_000608 [Coemansia spiralis]